MYDMEGFTSSMERLTLFDEETGEYFTVENPEYEYRKNEWCCLYTDDCGDLQKVPFDTYEQAQGYANSLREQYVNVIGVMTTRFYDNVKNIIE